jgi:transposase
LGHGLEAVRSLVEEGGLEAGLRGPKRPRPGTDDPRQYRDPGAPTCGRKKGGPQGAALGRSAGGFSTKIHILVDALGNPIEFLLTAGQVADVTQAEPLIRGHEAEAVIADKAYDSSALVKAAKAQGAEAVIPSKKNRKVPREYVQHLYQERKKVEWFINLLKQYRRVATRYEKTACNFLGFVHVASIMVLLR